MNISKVHLKVCSHKLLKVEHYVACSHKMVIDKGIRMTMV